MKKIVLVVLLCGLAAFAFGQSANSGPGLYVTPSLNLNVSAQDYLRGGSVGGMALYDFGFIALGVQIYGDYDVAFGLDLPMLLVLGFGRDFWLGVGQTVALGQMALADPSGTFGWAYGSFPNTYLLGANLFRLNLGFANLVIPTTVSFTVNGPTDTTDPAVQGLGTLVGILLGIKGSVGVGLEFKAF